MTNASIKKWGNSLAVRIPQTIINMLDLRENDEIGFEIKDHSLIITPVKKKHKTIEELFVGYNGNYSPEEVEWGTAVGEEIW